MESKKPMMPIEMAMRVKRAKPSKSRICSFMVLFI